MVDIRIPTRHDRLQIVFSAPDGLKDLFQLRKTIDFEGLRIACQIVGPESRCGGHVRVGHQQHVARPGQRDRQQVLADAGRERGLAGDEHTAAATLPFGKQRRLAIARALATRPRLLLLDEPAAGLRAAEIDALNRILLDLRAQRSISILLIDHVMPLVMAVSDWITVLNFGRKIAEGAPKTVRGSPEVIAAYLGEKAAHAFGA